MVTSRLRAEARRTAATLRGRLRGDLTRFCQDAGLTPTELARACGLNRSFVVRILEGTSKPSLETYATLAAGLGVDLSTRLYPNTGPAIRDRQQARILEWLLENLNPRWRPYTEVGIRQPVRGWIDAVLHEQRAGIVIATEIESELRRLEQQVRWAQEKATALPSWDGWRALVEDGHGGGGERDSEPAISRLLLVRRTRATRAVATEFARQLGVAYPAHPDDAVAALTGTASWSGPALVWVAADQKGVRFVPGR